MAAAVEVVLWPWKDARMDDRLKKISSKNQKIAMGTLRATTTLIIIIISFLAGLIFATDFAASFVGCEKKSFAASTDFNLALSLLGIAARFYASIMLGSRDDVT